MASDDDNRAHSLHVRLAIALVTLAGLFALGTIVYSKLEGWSWIDSFYFVGITLTTIGYGDLYPHTDAGKIFTVFFAIIGVALTLFVLTVIAETYFNRRMSKLVLLQKEGVEKIISKDNLNRLIPKKELDLIKNKIIRYKLNKHDLRIK